MKIISVDLNEHLSYKYGLKQVNMKKLGHMVILTGKNGSGKTRFFKALKDEISQSNTYLTNNNLYHNAHYDELLRRRTDLLQKKGDFSNKIILGDFTHSYQYAINDLESQIQRMESQQRDEFPILYDEPIKSNVRVIDYVPNILKLENWAEKPYNQLNVRGIIGEIGINNQHITTLAYIQRLQDQWFDSTHPFSTDPEIHRNNIVKEYTRLNDIINSFMSVRLGRTDRYSTLFGIPISQAQLSNGQCVLLQLCVALHEQGANLNDHILCLDEPENHLHPSVVIEFIENVLKCNPEGQIWIATHSIPLLSHFDPSSIWFVEDGEVRHAGKTPEKVLRSLLGDDTRIQKLRDFACLPSELAVNRFAFECLLPPGVVQTDSNDPQSKQTFSMLSGMWKEKETINILDYGAGKGRLIANLADYDPEIAKKLNYYAYDKCPDDRTICVNNIQAVYTDAENRYFNGIDDVRTKRGDESFDVIVMTNTLHEIPIDEWIPEIKEITKLLKNNGSLLIIEDCKIPVGELPHKKGFLVLNTLHLQMLFKIEPLKDTDFITNDAWQEKPEKKNRLMAHLIPKRLLTNISQDTIKTTLTELKATAIKEIKAIRSQGTSYPEGLSHGFWIQQLANAELCLAQYGE